MMTSMSPRAGRVPGPLGAWRDEVSSAVSHACDPEASVWDRSRAVRELERSFLPRLHAERARLAALGERLDSRTRERLWAAGELLELLHEELAESARLPFRGETFAADLTALLRGLDLWCDEAERAAGDHARR